MLFIFPAFLRQTFVENGGGYFGIFATTYAERGGRHLTLWNHGGLIAIKWLNGHSCRQFSSWYARTGVGRSTAGIVHTRGYWYEPKYSTGSTGRAAAAEIWALPVGGNQKPELPRAGVAWWCCCSLEIAETYHNATQSFSSSSLFRHGLGGFGIRRQWAKTCFISFRWQTLKEQLHISIAQVAQFEWTFLFLAAECSHIPNKYSVTRTGRVVWWLLVRGGLRSQLPVSVWLAPQGWAAQSGEGTGLLDSSI